jgi:hypothetical protein
MSGTWKRWQDWVIVVVGVVLFLTPFVFGATSGNPAVSWTAYVGGVLLAIAGLWSLASPSTRYLEWADVVIGILVFITPWAFGFTGLTAMAWSAWIAGILAIVLGAWVLFGNSTRQQLVGQR